MRFTDETLERGVSERRFDLEVEGRAVPGLLWTPGEARGSRPLVLLGHGGSSHKRAAYILAMARRLVRHHGFAAAAIDGPGHGDRVRSDLDRGSMPVEEWRRRVYSSSAFDDMIADWRETLDSLQKLDEVGIAPVGYWGVSMGTVFGLPFVAAEPRIQAAVLGLMGSQIPRAMRDAPSIRCPVLFVQQLEDELMQREHVVELFDAIGSDDKRLHANPGKHSAMPRDEWDATEAFLAERLKPA